VKEKPDQEQPLPEDYGGSRTGRRIGEILVDDGLVEPEQVETALDEQRRDKERKYLGLILMRKRLVEEREVFKRLSRQRGVQFHEVRDAEIPDQIIDRVPPEVAIEHNVLPVDYQDGELSVSMEDPFNRNLLRLLHRVIPDRIKPGFATRNDLHYAINRRYNNLVRSNPIVKDFFDGFAYLLEEKPFDSNKAIDLVIALTHLLDGSDIHLTFRETEFGFDLRIDGLLHRIPIPTRRLSPDHISQLRDTIKARSAIDPSRKDIPQQGWIVMHIEEDRLRARISALPLVDGEKIVLNVARQLKPLGFDQIGFSKTDKERIKAILRRPSGLILIAGHAGSGRTTTLYALLSKIPKEHRNIITIEDHVNVKLRSTSQVETNHNGLSQQDVLNALPSQDADIILIGNIANAESAQIAVKGALSGQLVLTSIDMENAAGAILRMLDLGVERRSFSTVLRLVIAQRLVPGICLECHAPHSKSVEYCRELGLPEDTQLFTGSGCAKCYFTGRMGRVALLETIVVDNELQDILSGSPSLKKIMDYSHEKSESRSFRDDALAKCVEGKIAPEETLVNL